MLPICIAIIILAISVIILSLNCLRLEKRIHNSVKYMDEKGFEIRIPYLAKRVEDDHKILMELDYAIKERYGVNCKECEHKGVCSSRRTRLKAHFDLFGFRTDEPKVLCSNYKELPKIHSVSTESIKETTIYGTAGPIE